MFDVLASRLPRSFGPCIGLYLGGSRETKDGEDKAAGSGPEERLG